MIWAFIGHRASGKSVLGKRVAKEMGRPFFDLDDLVKGMTACEISSFFPDREHEFRTLETQAWDHVLPESIVAPGAGIEVVPKEVMAIWLQREGWEVDALKQRPRLKPGGSEENEIEWMIEQRDKKYVAWADVFFPIPTGETEEVSATKLLEVIERMEASVGSPVLNKSFWIATPNTLERVRARVRHSRSEGVEVRSDLFSHGIDEIDEMPMLLSLRSNVELDKFPEPSSLDIDSSLLDVFKDCNADVHSEHDPSWKEPCFTSKAKNVKWAPSPGHFSHLVAYNKWSRRLRNEWPRAIILPQGKRWRWLRVLEMLRSNAWNYIEPSYKASQAGTMPWVDTSLFAHATAHARLYGLIGDPVEQSRGEVFHNQFFRGRGLDAIYVSVHLPPDELDSALPILWEFGFEGLSVTSPHKKSVLNEKGVLGDMETRNLESANTLLRQEEQKWKAFNTDPVGMCALLEELSDRDCGKGLLIGTGGVASSVKKACIQKGWRDLTHVGFRDPDMVRVLLSKRWNMVVNLSGQNLPRSDEIDTDVGIDLRYNQLHLHPFGRKFLNGEKFFEGQAKEQQRIWNLEEER